MRRKKKIESPERTAFLEQKGKQFAAELVRKATKWELDFKKKLEQAEVKFIFQKPVICDNKNLFILDFYIPELNLAIELDGKAHYTEAGLKYDRRRTSGLKRLGISVLRIQNSLVMSITVTHIKDLLSKYC